MIFRSFWCLWDGNVSRETKQYTMTKTGMTESYVPKNVRDYMLTDECFVLAWNKEYQAYQTTPRPAELAPYYNHPDYISHNDKRSGLIARAYRYVRHWNIRIKLKWLKNADPPGRKLLDYGSGTGDFLKVANELSWQGQGLEVNELGRSVAEKKGLSIFGAQSKLIDQTYDAITLWHVLEHLEDPGEMAKWLSRHLSARGVLLVAVPNYKSWDAKFYRHHWAAYDVPRHLWHFSQESIKTIFEQDFEITQKHPMWFDAIYVSLLSERYRKNKGNALRGILIGLVSNIRALFSNEPSSLTYVMKKRI